MPDSSPCNNSLAAKLSHPNLRCSLPHRKTSSRCKHLAIHTSKHSQRRPRLCLAIWVAHRHLSLLRSHYHRCRRGSSKALVTPIRSLAGFSSNRVNKEDIRGNGVCREWKGLWYWVSGMFWSICIGYNMTSPMLMLRHDYTMSALRRPKLQRYGSGQFDRRQSATSS